MAKETVDTSDKEIVNLDLGIEDAQILNADDLDSFLESDESVIGDQTKITPAKKQTPAPDNDDDDTSKLSKDDKEKARLAAIQKDKADKEAALKHSLVDDDDDDNDSTKGAGAKGDKTDDVDDTDSGIAAFSKELYNIGFFTKDEDDEDPPTTPEELLEKANSQYIKGANRIVENYLGRYGEKHRKAFTAIFEKGVDPEAYLAQQLKIETFEKMDLSDEDNQERVVKQALRNQNLEEDDIQEEIKRLKTNSDLEATSKRYIKGLIKAEQLKAKEDEVEVERTEKRLADIDAQYDYNLRTILSEKLKEKDFDGIPVTDSAVSKAYDFAYNKKWELNGAKLTDFDRFILDLKRPENHEVKAKLALLFAQDYDPNKPIKVDFSKIQKRAVSKQSSELFKDLTKKDKQTNKGQSTYKQATQSFFD